MTKYVRFRVGSRVAYGIQDENGIAELEGDLFNHRPTGTRHKLEVVTLLCPCSPGKILAVGRNFKTHFHGRPHPKRPELFYKPVSCLQDPDGPIVYAKDATDLHHEAELVFVIGKRLHRASKEEARGAIWGLTCGNDVSERVWQNGTEEVPKDVQWWRAKGSDTFGPLGPCIVTGLNPDNLRVMCRVNGEVIQDQSTADFIFDSATMVSFASQYVTIEPGDIIFTGTPGNTRALRPGDVVEVEIEGIGVLRNPVVAET